MTLGTCLSICSVIGAVLIVVGLYLVLWGKSKEAKKMNQLVPSDQIAQQCGVVEIVVASSLTKTDEQQPNEQPIDDSQIKAKDEQNTVSL